MNLYLPTLFIVFSFAFKQQIENDIKLPQGENGAVEWSGVVNTNDISRDQLMKRAKKFFKTDKEFGKLISLDAGFKSTKTEEFFISGDNASKYKCIYDLTIELKDARYKYTISNMIFEQFPKRAQPAPLPIEANKLYKDYRDLMDQGKNKQKKAKNSYLICKSASSLIDKLIEEILEAMSTEAVGSDDW
jgi:hypothetical protein